MKKLAIIFVALNLADYALTLLLLDRGGVEVNPIWGCVPLETKLVAAVLLAWVLRHRRVLAYLNMGMAAIVGWNTLMLGVI